LLAKSGAQSFRRFAELQRQAGWALNQIRQQRLDHPQRNGGGRGVVCVLCPGCVVKAAIEGRDIFALDDVVTPLSIEASEVLQFNLACCRVRLKISPKQSRRGRQGAAPGGLERPLSGICSKYSGRAVLLSAGRLPTIILHICRRALCGPGDPSITWRNASTGCARHRAPLRNACSSSGPGDRDHW